MKCSSLAQSGKSEIFKALERTKLLVGTRKDSHYSRCGRTDKGVSATGQSIPLYTKTYFYSKDPHSGSSWLYAFIPILKMSGTGGAQQWGIRPLENDFRAGQYGISRWKGEQLNPKSPIWKMKCERHADREWGSAAGR
ncbi:hypothetical protein KSP40_PGU009905 [Platanthera guangdongensis]|uniref:Uncharacterized protein n=1 Tax=Platanthera guangdongensis TaxID=2320717 RepID=A0ABR2N3X6_9ASPA